MSASISLNLSAWALALPLCLSLASAQSIQVFSEYWRVDPFGNPVAANPELHPREILSPAVARNGFSSFRIAVSIPAGGDYQIHIGQNPEGAVTSALYKEIYAKQGNAWTPVKLEHVELPYNGKLPDPASKIAGQTTQTFWLDLWVPGSAPVRRIKVEPQLRVGSQWWVYPMEVRVEPVKIPAPGTAPPESLREYLCGGQESQPTPNAPEKLIRRNQGQDVLLARSLEAKWTRAVLTKSILESAAPGFCAAAVTDPELALRARDYLYRKAQ